MKLIDKDALVAEIDKRRESNAKEKFFGRLVEDNYFLDFLNTLKVKEVDLKKEIENYLSSYWPYEKELHPFLGHMAKHFFELGRGTNNNN